MGGLIAVSTLGLGAFALGALARAAAGDFELLRRALSWGPHGKPLNCDACLGTWGVLVISLANCLLGERLPGVGEALAGSGLAIVLLRQAAPKPGIPLLPPPES